MQYENKYDSLNNEQWLPVPGFEGYYEASSYGRIKSLGRVYNTGIQLRPQIIFESFMKFKKDKDGYNSVVFHKDNEKHYLRVHRIVAMAFHPNPDNLPVVMHLDDDVQNNCAWNLRWGTVRENTLDAYRKGRKCSSALMGEYDPNSQYIVLGQYTLEWEPIREWPTYTDAQKNFTCNISRAIQSGGRAGGFRWKYLLKPIPEKQTA